MKKSTNKINLLSHQLKPLEYIISRCEKQHGIILNHYMGTGKTITGLVFLNNFPGKKKVLITPEGLDNIWTQEAKNLKITSMMDEVKILSYTDLANFEKHEEDIKDSICVLDEAHNLYDILEFLFEIPEVDKENPPVVKPRLINFIHMLYSTEKILLLSGTLIRSSNLTDLRWLINIAAGKINAVVPYNDKEFSKIFKKVSKVDKFYLQIFRPFIKLNPLNLLPKDFVKSVPINEKNIMDVLYTMVTGTVFLDISKKMVRLPDINSKLSVVEPARYKEIFNKVSRLTQDITLIRNFILMTVAFKGLRLIFNYIKAYYNETYNFVKLDTDKLKKAGVDKYFSYFNYLYSNNTDYPQTKRIVKKVKYTNPQIILLFKLIGFPENLKSKEYVDLELNNNIEEAELFKNIYSVSSQSVFTNNGRIIGNLYENPEKFKQILEVYLNSNKEQTVVYSNFYSSGIKLFSKFLKDNDVKHRVYSKYLTTDERTQLLKDFKSKKINMLLLHPEFYEGVNILGCRHLHILEPMLRSDQKDQLYSRVVRYKSHDHLDISDRNVSIYQWGCSLLYDFNKILHGKEYLKQWGESKDPNLTILDLFKNFKEHLSPDDRILGHYNKHDNFKAEFSKTIKNLSIDSSELPLKCCIWTPDNSCSDKSLKKCNKKIL